MNLTYYASATPPRAIVLDLEEWPDDWDRYTDSQLMGLLDRAQPAENESVGDSLPLRRQTDIPG